jgi:TonB family protein
MNTKMELLANWCRKAFAVMLLLGLAGAPQKAAGQDKSSSNSSVKENGGRKVKTKVNPAYPDVARQSHITGTVRVEAVVKPDGKVSEVRILGGSPILAKEVVTAVKNWQYGEGPKETLETVEVSFQF